MQKDRSIFHFARKIAGITAVLNTTSPSPSLSICVQTAGLRSVIVVRYRPVACPEPVEGSGTAGCAGAGGAGGGEYAAIDWSGLNSSDSKTKAWSSRCNHSEVTRRVFITLSPLQVNIDTATNGPTQGRPAWGVGGEEAGAYRVLYSDRLDYSCRKLDESLTVVCPV